MFSFFLLGAMAGVVYCLWGLSLACRFFTNKGPIDTHLIFAYMLVWPLVMLDGVFDKSRGKDSHDN